MLSLEITNNANALLVDFEESEPLLSGLRLLSKTEKDLDVHLHAIAAGGHGLNTAAGNAYNHLASARQVLPQIPSRAFFRALDRIASAIRKYASSNSNNAATVDSIYERLEEFSRNFEAFLNDQSGVKAVPVLRSATPLLVELETLRRTLASTVAQLTNSALLQGDEEVFSILFPDDQSLDEIAVKLKSLQEIFDLVARLIKHPAVDSARILRLEYGSFLAELAVSKSILKIARPWITGLAGFFYRTRTLEGSLDSTTTASKAAIKQALDVRQLLQKAGINTEEMDNALEEAGIAMAKNVAALIGNQIRFKVDDVEFHATRADLQLANRIAQQLPPPDAK